MHLEANNMRVAALILTAIMTVAVIAFGSPTTTFAGPDGRIDAATVPYNGFVHITMTGMQPSSPLSVSYSAGLADPWHVVENGLVSTNASGTGTVSFTPLVVKEIDRNFQGPIFVQVCDGAGTCVIFTITIGGSIPNVVARNKTEQSYCDVFTAIILHHNPPEAALFVLNAFGQNFVVQQALRCNFEQYEIEQLLAVIFPE